MQIAAAVVFSAAALLLAPVPFPAEAGVVMVQPSLKKVELIYNKEATPASVPRVKEEKKMKAEAGPPPVNFAFTEVPDLRLLALPASVGAIGALAFLVSKVDPESVDWFTTAIVKSNIDDGVGYEQKIKVAIPQGEFPELPSIGLPELPDFSLILATDLEIEAAQTLKAKSAPKSTIKKVVGKTMVGKTLFGKKGAAPPPPPEKKFFFF